LWEYALRCGSINFSAPPLPCRWPLAWAGRQVRSCQVLMPELFGYIMSSVVGFPLAHVTCHEPLGLEQLNAHDTTSWEFCFFTSDDVRLAGAKDRLMGENENPVVEEAQAAREQMLQRTEEQQQPTKDLTSEVTKQVPHRKQTEELAMALQSERNTLRVIMENTRAHLAYLDPEFNFVAVNSAYVQGCGHSREELIGRNHFALFPHPENQAIFERVRDTGEPIEFRAKPFEFPERPELETTYWDWTLVPVKGADGQTEGLVLSLMDVTEQVRAQAEIESLSRFPRENPNPVLRVTRDGTILYANPGSAPLLAHWGVQVEQKVPHDWQQYIAGTLDTGLGRAVESPCEECTFLLTIAPVTQEGYANLYGLEVTERKRARQALQESEERFRTVADFTYDWEYWAGPDGEYLYISPSCERITGYSAEEFFKEPGLLDMIVHPDDRALVAAHMCEERKDGKIHAIDFRITTHSGGERWIGHVCQPVYAESGDWLGWRASNRDITEQKRAQHALRQYADRLRGLHEIDQAILAAHSVDDIAKAALVRVPHLLDCRWADVMLYDLDAGEMSLLALHVDGETQLGRDWRGGIDVEWRRMLEELGRGVAYFVEDVQQMSPVSEWWTMLQAEGVRAFVTLPLIIAGELMGSLNLGMRRPEPLTADQMEIARELATQLAIGIQQARLYEHLEKHADQLEREVSKRTQALRASEARFRAIFEGAGIGITLVDGKGRMQENNPALQELLGYSAEELRGKPLADFAHPDDVTADLASHVGVMAQDNGGKYRLEGRYIRRDGRLCWAKVIVSLVRERRGKPQFAIVMVEDITEQKRAEEALIQSEKLAVTGRLAASLAHEINNPLQSVVGCLELVEESLADGKDAGQFLQLATRELERVTSIVGQLRDLNRPPKLEERTLTDVTVLVDHVLVLTSSQCQRQGVEVEWKAADDLPSLRLVPDQIQQVFLNLTLNAVEAMPSGGRLEVSASATDEPLGVCISFADSGKGIAADAASHLFEPFYTTKPDGMGLGLYVTHNIVEEHGGHIEMESREGEGATFTVWLPA
jgi:PAS domain S-box-containing protein